MSCTMCRNYGLWLHKPVRSLWPHRITRRLSESFNCSNDATIHDPVAPHGANGNQSCPISTPKTSTMPPRRRNKGGACTHSAHYRLLDANAKAEPEVPQPIIPSSSMSSQGSYPARMPQIMNRTKAISPRMTARSTLRQTRGSARM